MSEASQDNTVPAPVTPAPSPDPRRARWVERPLLVFSLLAAGLGWGAWTTRAILDLRRAPQPLVKVQLGALVAEYVRGQARSATPPEQITAQTQAFMKLLDTTLAREARAGRVVLVSEAVAGGSLPDITGRVRREVYAQMPPPRAGGDNHSTEAQMRDWLLDHGGSDAAGH